MLDKCKVCGSKNVLYVEYPWVYDGICEIHCQDCKARVGRWSEKVLIKDENEKRYGK